MNGIIPYLIVWGKSQCHCGQFWLDTYSTVALNFIFYYDICSRLPNPCLYSSIYISPIYGAIETLHLTIHNQYNNIMHALRFLSESTHIILL